MSKNTFMVKLGDSVWEFILSFSLLLCVLEFFHNN